MAAPLSGIAGQQQQIPASNTFKPGEQQVRQQEDRRQAGDTTQTDASQTVERSQNVLQTQQAESLREGQAEHVEQRRGSVVDITV